jgi:hypothetical protein
MSLAPLREASEEEAIVDHGAEEIFRISAGPHPPIAFLDADGTRHQAEPEVTYPVLGLVLRDATIHFPNVVSLPGGILLDANVGYTSSELCDHGLPDYPLVRDRVAVGIALRTGTPCAYHCRDQAGAICVAAQSNFSAWLLGELPRVLLAGKHVKGIKVILHGDARPFHFDSLADAGVPADRIQHVPAEGHVRADRLVWVTSTYFHQVPHPAGTLEIVRLGTLPDRSDRPRIYASRSNPGITMRRIVNEPEVERLLEGRGFSVIRPELLSYGAQKGYAAGARVFAAPFGAALASTVFCREGSIVLHIATKFSFEFIRLAAQRNLHLIQVRTLRRKVRDGPNYSASHDFMIEPAEMEKALALADTLQGTQDSS